MIKASHDVTAPYALIHFDRLHYAKAIYIVSIVRALEILKTYSLSQNIVKLVNDIPLQFNNDHEFNVERCKRRKKLL